MKDVSRYLKNHSASILPIAILGFLAVATILTLTLTRKSTEYRSQALTDNGQLTFANLNPVTVNPGQTFNVSVNMTGGGQTVIGADILVHFDSTRLQLINITKNSQTSNPYKTYAPVDTNGNFDTVKVINNASSGNVEFGIVAFDWGGNNLTSPNPTTSNLSPVATLTFGVKPQSGGGGSQLSFVNNGIAATTDSNIVVNTPGGDPEDILQAPGYANGTVTVTIGGNASPPPTPRPSPSATPGSSPPSCVLATVSQCFDLNGDGIINIQDITQLANRYNATPSNPTLYSTKHDLNCDSIINIIDITLLANRYNVTSCSRQ